MKLVKDSRIQALDVKEKVDLFAFSHTETCRALYKLMENLVLDARDEAMAVPPEEEKLQKAKMDMAHAMSKFYTRLRKEIESTASEHIGELQRIANEEVMKDQDAIESIILDQAVNPLAHPHIAPYPVIS